MFGQVANSHLKDSLISNTFWKAMRHLPAWHACYRQLSSRLALTCLCQEAVSPLQLRPASQSRRCHSVPAAAKAQHLLGKSSHWTRSHHHDHQSSIINHQSSSSNFLCMTPFWSLVFPCQRCCREPKALQEHMLLGLRSLSSLTNRLRLNS